MKRTTVTLPDELAAAAEREAHRRRTSVSEVVREALAARLGKSVGRRRISFAALGESGSTDTAASAEDILRREWTDHLESER